MPTPISWIDEHGSRLDPRINLNLLIGYPPPNRLFSAWINTTRHNMTKHKPPFDTVCNVELAAWSAVSWNVSPSCSRDRLYWFPLLMFARIRWIMASGATQVFFFSPYRSRIGTSLSRGMLPAPRFYQICKMRRPAPVTLILKSTSSTPFFFHYTTPYVDAKRIGTSYHFNFCCWLNGSLVAHMKMEELPSWSV